MLLITLRSQPDAASYGKHTTLIGNHDTPQCFKTLLFTAVDYNIAYLAYMKAGYGDAYAAP
jgi:hypothetical protein